MNYKPDNLMSDATIGGDPLFAITNARMGVVVYLSLIRGVLLSCGWFRSSPFCLMSAVPIALSDIFTVSMAVRSKELYDKSSDGRNPDRGHQRRLP
jgi:hypothetical protein